ncbi:AI-2E family transporter [Candidatus Micrarchaeota archaeon]|nr:AI-2E family transporter [Candidatus Micrarchaeota archaeon]MBD3418344.1 AI-2E family transporter [Candidatus Micrarchaeota archaeon]
MKEAAKEKKYLALVILLLFALFFFYAAMPLLLGISGAAILYVLLKPIYLKLNKRLNRKMLSAITVLLFSFILIVLPILVLFYFAVVDIATFLQEPGNLNTLLSYFPVEKETINLEKLFEEHILEISNFATGISLLALDVITNISINLVVMYLILYYLLTENRAASSLMRSIIPFNKKNSEKLASEFYNIINATFITNGAVAVVIGVLLAAGLYLAGAENIIFWGVLGTLTAIIPVIGIQIIWIPAGIYYIFGGHYVVAAALMLWGAFLSYIFDGYVRQLVQKRIGSIHPFVSIVGLIIGVAYFGVTGIIIGPLLISIFVLTAQMFREEYVPGWGK